MATTTSTAVKTGTIVECFPYDGRNYIKTNIGHVMISNLGFMDLLQMTQAKAKVRYIKNPKNTKYWAVQGYSL